MSTHRIVCTTQSAPPKPGHGHILAVGIGTDPNSATTRLTVSEVRAAINRGEVFYTVSPSSGKTAIVEPYDCWCGHKTIRTTPDRFSDNNLDNLRLCNWQS